MYRNDPDRIKAMSTKQNTHTTTHNMSQNYNESPQTYTQQITAETNSMEIKQ